MQSSSLASTNCRDCVGLQPTFAGAVPECIMCEAQAPSHRPQPVLHAACYVTLSCAGAVLECIMSEVHGPLTLANQTAMLHPNTSCSSPPHPLAGAVLECIMSEVHGARGDRITAGAAHLLSGGEGCTAVVCMLLCK